MEQSINKKAEMKYRFLSGISVLLSYTAMTAVLIPFGFLFMLITNDVSTNPFTLSTTSDLIMIGLFLISGVGSFILLYIFRNTKYNNWTAFFVYPGVVFISSLVPLLVHYKKINSNVVKQLFDNTNIFTWTMAVLLLVGWLVTAYLSRDLTKKTNWWLFISVIPYALTGFALKNNYQSVRELAGYSDFSYQTVAEMINGSKGDIRLVNPMWFNSIGITIGAFIIILGGITFGIVWIKTKEWRKKARKSQKIKTSQD